MKPLIFLLLASGMMWSGSALRAETLQELKDRETKVRAVVQRVMPSVVAVTSADPEKPGSGSGVIISKEGLILTAAHVTQATGNDLTIIFPDGRRVKGTSLGVNRTTDAGMAKITDPGEWPLVEMGASDGIHLGDWVIAMGHPGGYSYERQPPVRLGRVWRRDLDGAMFSSCPLIGGDSGGPLFDMDGRVVGIHSSIHGNVAMNRHVAIDTLRFDWDKLIKDQTWGDPSFNSLTSNRPVTGAIFDRESSNGVVVKDVLVNLPAEKAGLKSGDVVTRVDGESVANFFALQRLIGRRKPGETVPLGVRRGDEEVEIQLRLGRRSLVRRDGNGEEFAEPAAEEPQLPEADAPRAWLGAVGEETADGVLLEDLEADGPAARAGVQAGDLLSEINRTAVPDAAAAAELLRNLTPGEKATLKVRRGSETLDLEITLGRK